MKAHDDLTVPRIPDDRSCSVFIEPGGLRLTAEAGTDLLRLLRSADLAPESPCGGHGACGKCTVLVDGVKKLACRTMIEKDMTVTLPERFRSRILTAASIPTQADDGQSGPCLAFDIGTTTVVCSLAFEGKQYSAGRLNPQKAWGADVVSRIRAAMDGQQEQLTDAIRACMTRLIQDVCALSGVLPGDIRKICAVGNPCMQQLFLGLDVNNLASIPFLPKITRREQSGPGPFSHICPKAELLTVPDISGYVGADTVACIAATRLHETDRTVLLVDIGTNGELVLRHHGRMAACSTAAGPALEGAGIRFGMRAEDGSIDHVSLSEGHLQCHVIGDQPPRGICGSGIIDAAAAALSLGLLDRRGRILSGEQRDGTRVIPLAGPVFLTQEDIREIQLAKGAIAAGILVLCDHFRIRPEDIDEVLLAGAFGSFIDPDSACRIGLLPPLLQGRIRAAGNAAGAGALLFSLHPDRFRETDLIVESVEAVELAAAPSFRKLFASSMYF